MGKAARAKHDRSPGGDGGTSAGSDLDAQLAELPPEQLELFVKALALTMRRRRLMLVGYLGALVTVTGGQIGALVIWASREPGTFIGWIFLVPLALAGAILLGTARLVRRVKPPP